MGNTNSIGCQDTLCGPDETCCSTTDETFAPCSRGDHHHQTPRGLVLGGGGRVSMGALGFHSGGTRGSTEFASLCGLIRSNDIAQAKLKSALEANPASVIEMDSDGNTMLHYAVVCNNLMAAEQIIRNGADIEATNNRGYTVMHVATTMSGCTAMVRRIITLKRKFPNKARQIKQSLQLKDTHADTQHTGSSPPTIQPGVVVSDWEAVFDKRTRAARESFKRDCGDNEKSHKDVTNARIASIDGQMHINNLYTQADIAATRAAKSKDALRYVRVQRASDGGKRGGRKEDGARPKESQKARVSATGEGSEKEREREQERQ